MSINHTVVQLWRSLRSLRSIFTGRGGEKLFPSSLGSRLTLATANLEQRTSWNARLRARACALSSPQKGLASRIGARYWHRRPRPPAKGPEGASALEPPCLVCRPQAADYNCPLRPERRYWSEARGPCGSRLFALAPGPICHWNSIRFRTFRAPRFTIHFSASLTIPRLTATAPA